MWVKAENTHTSRNKNRKKKNNEEKTSKNTIPETIK